MSANPYSSQYSPPASDARPGDRPNLTELIKQLGDDATTLVRQEVALVKAEFAEKTKRAALDAATIPAGGAVAYAGVILMLVGITLAVGWGLIALGMAPLPALVVSFIVLGLIVTTVGAIVAKHAVNRVTQDDLTPSRTLESIHENKQWIKDKAQ